MKKGFLSAGSVDVGKFLRDLDVKNITAGGSEVTFSCPFPGHSHGDHRPSARMNAQTTAWYCHGCKRHGNAVTFVSYLQSVTTHVAYAWMVDAFGVGASEDVTPDDLVRELDLLMAQEIMPTEDESVSESKASRLPSFVSLLDEEASAACSYWTGRGFLLKTALDSGVEYDTRLGRIVFPMNDVSGMCVGWKGRAVPGLCHEGAPKYLVYDPPYQASRHVYLLDTFVPYDDTIIVCEGELNALMMRQNGWGNAVGLPGSHLSRRQAGLVACSARKAILIFDSDDAGYRGVTEAASLLDLYMHVSIVPDHERDPASLEIPIVQSLLDDAQTQLEWEIA